MQDRYCRKKKDLKKAFDRVSRAVIKWALRKKGIKEKLADTVLWAAVRTEEGVVNELSWTAPGLC